MYNINRKDYMNNSTITFPLKTGKKTRILTTYNNNYEGDNLRKWHHTMLDMLIDEQNIDYKYAFAYLPKQSIKKLVNMHLSNNYFYLFDISNFFPSIDHQILLSKIGNSSKYEHLVYTSANGKSRGLAIGLVPSPFLSNVYLVEFDTIIAKKLGQLDDKLVYTRYSDDISISSGQQLDIEVIQNVLADCLQPLKLRIHEGKTHHKVLLKKGDHVKLLGLNIIRGENENYITVGRKFKRNTEKEHDQMRKKAMNAYIKYNE